MKELKIILVLWYLLFLSVTVSCTEVSPSCNDIQVEHTKNAQDLEFEPSVMPINITQPDTIPEQFLKIRNRVNARNSEYIGLEFWDERTIELITYVDRDSLNPFARMPFPSKEQSGYFGTTEYSLQGVSREVLVRTLGAWDTPDYLYDTVVTAASTMAKSVNKPTARHYAVMTFQLYLTNSRGQVIAIIDKYYVFNDRGDITAIVDNNKGGYPGAIVSQDGRWLAVKYGGQFDENHVLPEGLMFFSTDDGRLKYCDSISGISNFTYLPFHDYFVCMEAPTWELLAVGREMFSIYKLDLGIKYTKIFGYRDIGIPRNSTDDYYNKDGIYYGLWDPLNRIPEDEKPLQKALFDIDFEKSELKSCDQ